MPGTTRSCYDIVIPDSCTVFSALYNEWGNEARLFTPAHRGIGEYVLIDGERRWRCCARLGMETMPSVVYEKQTDLDHLSLMFHMSSNREQWDLFTIAMTLPRMTDLLTWRLGKEPSRSELSEYTGLSEKTLRNSGMIVSLPEDFKKRLLEEYRRPGGGQHP